MNVLALKIQKSLGIAIRQLRTQAGISQETFAAEIGIHRTYIGAIERGERNPSLRNIFRIADALQISLSDLFHHAENISDSTK